MRIKKLYMFCGISFALAVGGFAGFYIASARYSHTATDIIASYEFNRAADVFTTLRDLRDGNTNEVFSQLEGELDLGVLSLNTILEEVPSIEYAKNYRNMFRRIEDYRTKFPRRTEDTNLDMTVSSALAGANKDSAR